MGAGVIAVGDPNTLFAVTPGSVDDLAAIGGPSRLLAWDLNGILLVISRAQEIDAPVGATSGSVKGDHIPVRCPGSPACRPLAHILPYFYLSDITGKVSDLQP